MISVDDRNRGVGFGDERVDERHAHRSGADDQIVSLDLSAHSGEPYCGLSGLGHENGRARRGKS